MLTISLIALVGMLSIPFSAQKVEAVVRDISLFGHSSQGWGFTSTGMTMPGPTITVDQDDLVGLTLTGMDGTVHNFFVDYDGNTNPSVGEPKSPDFTGTTNYDFTADTAGTFTYYCQYHKLMMYGTFVVTSLLDTSAPRVEVLSPENTTYSVNAVALVFVLNETASWMGYSLDGQPNATVSGNATLFSLLEGTHTMIVYANDTSGNMGSSARVHFTIQPSSVDISPPSILILSPENRTYSTSSVPLNFVVDETTPLMWYGLDGQANVSIAGNTTLSNLPAGSHNIVVFATDFAANTGSSEIIYFTIEIPGVQPFPIEVIVAIVIVAVIVVGIVAYFMRSRSKKKLSGNHEGLIRLVGQNFYPHTQIDDVMVEFGFDRDSTHAQKNEFLF